MTLREVLHAHIPMLRAGSTFRDAVDRMDIYQFPALVMVDENENVTHVVTEGDLSRAASQRGDLTSLASEPVMIYCTEDPIVGSPAMEVGDALHLMLSHGITILPVVEDRRLLGIVLRMDLMQAVLLDVIPTA
jgi:CBS domain-containing protein